MVARALFVTVGWVVAWFGSAGHAAEHVVVDQDNYDAVVPAGKEVDAIFGDHVLRSDRLVAVVAEATDTRNANMTVKGVGGAVIDFTTRQSQSDQLSCYYPHGGTHRLEGPIDWPEELPSAADSAKLAFRLAPVDDSLPNRSPCTMVLGYELEDGKDYLTLRSLVHNPTDETQSIVLRDGIRADGEFRFGMNSDLGLWWCQDSFWRQAYGVVATDEAWTVRDHEVSPRQPRQIRFQPADGNSEVELAAGESLVFERRLLAAADTFELIGKVAKLQGLEVSTVNVTIRDADGPVAGAEVRAIAGDRLVAVGQTGDEGTLAAALPPGDYQWRVAANGRERENLQTRLTAAGVAELEVQLPQLGQVAGTVVNESGKGVPCRVAFFGQGVADPHFGPDSAVHGVRNLWHTHDGRFEVDLLPGSYELVISRGPEYDAVIQRIEVTAGETSQFDTQLVRSVDTTGWISAELHSHSSPSGDNTSSQRGRVLNLLVEHLEFIPCTEHQRISTYIPHLEHFDAVDRVLTCCGMELTGSPLPINHQNAFPLRHRPRTQDGGGPVVDVDPVVQIERLAMWDNGSDKVVQINHPNIAQMIGDRDRNNQPDEGFRQMFSFADVMEVHPPAAIFEELTVGEGGWGGRGNAIKNWMQMLNLGYRIPGVVNTDAHWNYYGSGWLRNYVRSSTDNPAEADLAEVCHALEKGQVVMTNGPFLEVEARSGEHTAGPGDDLAASSGSTRLAIRVQCPNWMDVNRVQVFANGRPHAEYNFTRSANADVFGDGVVKFEHEFPVALDRDTHLIVAAAAEGRQLGLVYGEEQGRVMPIAVSNPIFVDVDGEGFEANGDMLGVPLPVEPNHHPTHGHYHPHLHD